MTETPVAPAVIRHILYRFFDHGGVLLYVGVTNNPPRRFAQHSSDKDWWDEVASITVENHPTRQHPPCRRA